MGTFRDESRLNWTGPGNSTPDSSQLQVGCLQRIADAAEKMADGFNAVLKERDHYKEWSERYRGYWDQEKANVEASNRQISALRGQITKLKKRLEANNGR